MLNFYNSFINMFVINNIVFWSLWLVSSKSMNTYFLDSLNRTYLLDTFVASYYYFWTSFWYIPTVVLILILVVLYTRVFKVLSFGVITFIITIFFIYELSDYWLLSLPVIDLCTSSENINPLLSNSINKYHPFIFYITLTSNIIAFIYYQSINYTNLNNKFFFNCTSSYILNNTRFNILLINFTLFLGSWWALQEGSWGGWWNWDTSEVFGMLIMIWSSLFMHGTGKPNLRYTTLGTNYVLFLITGLVYVFIQLNFSLVSHNFGIKSSQFVNTMQMFFIIFAFLITALLWKVSINFNYIGIINNTSIFIKSFRKNILNVKSRYIILMVIISSTVVISFYPLINDFLWKVNSISVLNIPITIGSVVSLLVVLIYSIFFRLNVYYLLLLITLSTYVKVDYLIITFIILSTNVVNLLHTSVLIFVLVSYLNWGRVIVIWMNISRSDRYSQQLGLQNLCEGQPSVVSSNTIVNELSIYDGLYTNFSLSYFSDFSSPDNNLFRLIMCLNHTVQSMSGSVFNDTFYINVIDRSIIPLLLMWYMSNICIILYFSKKKLIIS